MHGAPHEFTLADDPPRAKEYTLKAAFLFNFLKYTTWPKGTFERPDDPILLAIVGRDPFGSLLEHVLSKKKVGAHPIRILRFKSVEEVKQAHAIFLGELSAKERASLYARLAGKPVLIIGDERGLASKDGAVASFFLKDGKVRFEVSTEAIRRAGLAISSQLLKLADIVEKRR